MQTKKMSLANVQGKLSRAEMKNIMAGSGVIAAGPHKCCWTNNPTVCSTCAAGWTCQSGAFAKAC